MVDMAADIDLASLVPPRRYGTYPSPLSSYAGFERARKMVDADKMTIDAISKKLGYQSSSSFSSAWKSKTGHTPTVWRGRPKSERNEIRKRLKAVNK